MTINVLIVDDEPLAQEGIELLLTNEQDFKIVGFCNNGNEALEKIPILQPDLVFLDINMPGMNGLEVIKTLGPSNFPLVIFLTAYDDHAIEAFTLNALDYILKPVTQQRFKQSLKKAKSALNERGMQSQKMQLNNLLESLEKKKQASPDERLMVRVSDQIFFLKPKEIIRIKAEGDYVSIYTLERSYLVRETMKNMETKLSKDKFQRIHRSSIVNIESVKAIQSAEHDSYQVILKDDTPLSLSKTYRDELYKKLQYDV